MAEIKLPPVSSGPTLGLCIITSSYTEELHAKLTVLLGHSVFNRIYVQINGPGQFAEAKKTRRPDKVEISEYTWNDNFADARNALLEEVQTDYWTWMDTDDTIHNFRDLPKIVAQMATSAVDIMFAPYEYNRRGDIVTELQYRERVIRTSCPGGWAGVIHETWIPAGDAVRETTSEVVWRHWITPESLKASMIRNRRILESEYSQEPRDPRISYYLGLNYAMNKHYDEAINAFMDLVETSGWDEEIYRAWLQIFSCYFELGSYEPAELAAHKAMSVLPDWPDAYFMLQQLYYQTDDHEKSLEWYRTGASKPEPVSDSAFNPIVRWYQPKELAAYSYLATGEAEIALGVLQSLIKLNPNYQLKPELKTEILRGVNEARAIRAVKTLVEFVPEPRVILEALPSELKADIRLTAERRKYIPGTKWLKGSVVFYCGPSFEDWGPDTLGDGMGGSEEAVVYLARELTESGVHVAVYNQRASQFEDTWPTNKALWGVDYVPWTEINPNDEFDVFVAWRSPAGIDNIKARRKLVDLHDIIDQELVYKMLPHVDKYLFKSKFHRSLYPDVPDSKAAIIGNGLVKEQFNEAS